MNIRHRRSKDKRFGGATVELAVCLPLLVVLVLGSLSATSLIFMRQAIVQSAYETVKEAVRTDGTVADALVRGEEVLSFRNIVASSVEFDPADPESAERGTPITVTIRAGVDPNKFYSFGPFLSRTIQVSATMVKE